MSTSRLSVAPAKPFSLRQYVVLPNSQTTISTRPTATTTTATGDVAWNNINIWSLAAAVGGLIVVGAGVIYYFTRRPFSDDNSLGGRRGGDERARHFASSTKPLPPHAAVTAAQSNATSNMTTGSNTNPISPPRSALRQTRSSTSASPPTLSDEELSRLLFLSLQSLQQGHLDESLESQLRTHLRDPRPLLTRSMEVRALYAQWLLHVCTYHITSVTDEDAFDRLMRTQERDMHVAWQLLTAQHAVTDDATEAGLDSIRIQVSQNLKDARLMLPVFDRMIARNVRDMEDSELTLLFTVAPLLGRWAEVRRLGNLLAERIGGLSDFHNAPIDYEALYELALDSATQPPRPLATPAISSLQWQQYRILVQRIKLRDVACNDAEAVAQLRDEFGMGATDTSDDGWKSVQLQESSRIIRCGAVVQAASFSAVPITLVGPGDGQRMECKGYVDLQAECVVRQREGYVLRCVSGEEEMEDVEEEDSAESEEKVEDRRRTRLRVKAGVDREWRGEYTMTQEKADEDGPGRFARIHVVFDLEMTLRSLPPL